MAEDRHHCPNSLQDIGSLPFAKPKEHIHLVGWVTRPHGRLRVIIAAIAVSPSSGKLFLLQNPFYGTSPKIIVFDQERKYVTSFGTHRSEEGELNHPWGIALVDGLVYVTNTNNHRIEVFTEDGTFRQQFGSGQLSNPEPIRIHDQLLYIGDVNNHRIAVYTLQGEHVCCIGTGEKGIGPGQFRTIRDIAFSPDGCMYVLDTGMSEEPRSGERIQVFARNGQYKMDLELDHLQPACCLYMFITNDGDLLLGDTKYIHGIGKLHPRVVVLRTHENEAKPELVKQIRMCAGPGPFAIDKKGNILVLHSETIDVL